MARRPRPAAHGPPPAASPPHVPPLTHTRASRCRRYLLLAFSERLFQPFGLQDCISTLGTCVAGNCYTAVPQLGISWLGLSVIGLLFIALIMKQLFSQWTKSAVKAELVHMKQLGLLSTTGDLAGDSVAAGHGGGGTSATSPPSSSLI